MKLLIALTLLAAAASAEITVTVSRTVPLPVTEARFNIVAETRSEVPYGEVLLALQPAGVTAADLLFVSAREEARPQFIAIGQPASVTWQFRITTRAADLPATLARLAAAATEARNSSGARVIMTYSLYSQGPSAADLENARRALLPQLWNDAKVKAQTLAEASGTRLEGVAALSEPALFGPIGLGLSYAGFLLGDFSLPAYSQLRQVFYLSARFADRPAAGTEGVEVSPREVARPVTQLDATYNLTGPLTLTLDQAVAILRPLGVTAGDLFSTALVNSRTGNSISTTLWSFRRNLPIAEVSTNLQAIEALRPTLAAGHTFTWEYGQVTAAALTESQRAAATIELVATGKRSAQDLLRAAGFDLGDLLSISEQSYGDYGPSLNLRYAIKK